MRVAIRVDASPRIGIGHVMRCLTLADALKARGALTRFVCRHLPSSLRELLDSKGHGVALLDSQQSGEDPDELSHAHFLQTSQRRDADDTLAALRDATWDWLVVDHYAIDARWESALRQVARRIMVIDDVADRRHDCDMLLDQNIYADMATRYRGKVPAHSRQLLGPQHALLRDEFRKLRASVAPRRGPVRRILVLFGGVDPHDLTSRTIAALQELSDQLRVDVVIGAEHPNSATIQANCAQAGYACHVQSGQIAALMSAADLALGAGGSTSWERCCLGLASVCASFADNQYHIAAALQDAGACVFVGDQQLATQSRIKEAVSDLVGDPERLQRMSTAAFALVDGVGAQRVCDVMGGIG